LISIGRMSGHKSPRPVAVMTILARSFQGWRSA
jgi:hypothetical protein